MRTFWIVMCSLIMCVQCVRAEVEVPKARGDVRNTVLFAPVWEYAGPVGSVAVKPLSKW